MSEVLASPSRKPGPIESNSGPLYQGETESSFGQSQGKRSVEDLNTKGPSDQALARNGTETRQIDLDANSQSSNTSKNVGHEQFRYEQDQSGSTDQSQQFQSSQTAKHDVEKASKTGTRGPQMYQAVDYLP